MKNKLFSISISSIFALVIIVAIAVSGTGERKAKYVFSENECTHDGYRYAAKDPTETEDGNVEFWTCCICHNHFLERPQIGNFVDASQPYGYELPADVIVPKDTKIAVNSCVLTFDGVQYSSNDWSAKPFLLGAGAPAWSLAADPAEAAPYIDTWITKNEVRVPEWPTEVGKYVFCVGISSSNTHIKFGNGTFKNNFYISFSIVEAIKVTPVVTLVHIGLTSSGEAVSAKPKATAGKVAASLAVSFSADPAGAAPLFSWSIYGKPAGGVGYTEDLGTEAPDTHGLPVRYLLKYSLAETEEYNAVSGWVKFTLQTGTAG